MKTPSEIVHAYFSAYETKDREAILLLLAPHFTFSSSDDDQISRDTYLRKCWPNSENHESFEIVKLIERGDEAYVTYMCERKNGETFRNTEFFQTENGQVIHVDVYFGPDTGPK